MWPNKWFVMIVHQLQRGTKRYSELKRDIPGRISQRMLTHTLPGDGARRLVNRPVSLVLKQSARRV